MNSVNPIIFAFSILLMKKETYVKSLRSFRKYHRFLGIVLAVLLLISSVTGILLAWKKNITTLQPATQKGQSDNLEDWLPISELAHIAQQAIDSTQASNEIDKIDVRPSKGIAKFIFKKENIEVQVDGATGEVKSIAKRHSDWIESLHDGSIISDNFKLGSMTFLGLGLILLLSTGYWLWYAPKKVRALKKR